ncbi:hypothetical protein [Methylocaldum szegediense]|uniref:hypothetical protein n=1 Tax=Methylocaldum szegediense TaxID=73780 RepID=UPI001F2D1811|nr:hypothetical protein [Methylocaldum szegediense]
MRLPIIGNDPEIQKKRDGFYRQAESCNEFQPISLDRAMGVAFQFLLEKSEIGCGGEIVGSENDRSCRIVVLRKLYRRAQELTGSGQILMRGILIRRHERFGFDDEHEQDEKRQNHRDDEIADKKMKVSHDAR